MRRIILATATLTAVALALSATAFSRGAATPTLKGAVGPGFTITLTQSGKKVKTLKPGSYKFVIGDKASIHNFVIEGPKGFTEKAITQVSFVGTKTVTLNLKAGKYKYYCRPHESTMFGNFTVK
jgi:plastocyanin